jgi:hypothetical protein
VKAVVGHVYCRYNTNMRARARDPHPVDRNAPDVMAGTVALVLRTPISTQPGSART